MITIYGVSIVLYFIKLFSGNCCVIRCRRDKLDPKRNRYVNRSLAISRHLGLFPKQAKITFVIHGDIGSETTKLYMIRCNVYITKQNIES